MISFVKIQKRKIFSLLAVLFILSAVPITSSLVQNYQSLRSSAFESSGPNLVYNPGFEDGNNLKADGWYYINPDESNTIEWISGDVRSGNKAMKLAMTKPEITPFNYIGISSNWFNVTPGALVEASAWIKANDIIWQKYSDYPGWLHFRIHIQAYDETKTQQLKVWNFGGKEGTISNWKNIQGHFIVPENAVFMRIQVWINHATGTLLVDDLVVKQVKTIPSVSVSETNSPNVIPKPMIMNSKNNTVNLGEIAIVNFFNESGLQEELEDYFLSIGKNITFLNDKDSNLRKYDSVIRFGNSNDSESVRVFRQQFRNKGFSELGEEGYFLSVVSKKQNLIYLAANTSRGRFYALQTLKQLIKNDSIFVVDVFDKPSINRRGITQPAEWWSKERDQVVQGAAEVKYNYIWYQGELFYYKLATKWRDPFNNEDLAIMKTQSDLCKKHFIDCYFSFRPRGTEPPLSYSSDSDINIIVDKMSIMYNQGVRNFGLSFDDLEYVNKGELVVQNDIVTFNNDIGLAHKYFITEIYNKLKSKHGDINFGVVPLIYKRSTNHNSKQVAYLTNFATIPGEIDILSSEYFSEDIDTFYALTNRKVNVWDNLYAFTYPNKGEPFYTIPFMSPANWKDDTIRSKTSGITFLPRTYKNELNAGISWYTMADFAWAPERYDPDTSYKNVLQLVR